MQQNIAIDGPAGAGKSTIARKLAARLGFIYVDTGAMYRAMALFLMRNKISPDDVPAITRACREADITLDYEDGEQKVILNGENVNAFIRTEEVSKMTSDSSKQPVIREKMVALQKKLAAEKNVVMDGRDIGTTVLPDAFLKIYMTADSRERARRRYEEQRQKGMVCDLDAIEKDIISRDAQDMNRETSPLRKAEDAILLDTTTLGIEEVVTEMLRLFAQRKAD